MVLLKLAWLGYIRLCAILQLSGDLFVDSVGNLFVDSVGNCVAVLGDYVVGALFSDSVSKVL